MSPPPFTIFTIAIAVAVLFSFNVVLVRAQQNGGGAGECCRFVPFAAGDVPVVVVRAGRPFLQNVNSMDEVDASLCICDSGVETLSQTTQVGLRGSSSRRNDKKSFKLKLNESVEFLGMPKNRNFILYGPENDMTLGIRNWLPYDVARASGRYASRVAPVEVYLSDDGSAEMRPEHYRGLYLALERIERDKDRVDIQKFTPPDLSGGYLFVYDNDNIDPGDVTVGPLPGWTHPFVVKYPDPLSPGAGDELLRYLKTLDDSASDPARYPLAADVPSFIDYMLVTELSKNPDGYRGSTYMSKDKGGPIMAGPVWDFNEAWGLCCGYPIDGWQRNGESGPGVAGGSAISPEGWRFLICEDRERCLVEPGDGTSRWFRAMWLNDPSFQRAAAARWRELRAGPWSDTAIASLFDSYVETLSKNGGAIVKRNFARYPQLLNSTGKDGEGAWQEAVGQMQEWVNRRLKWMDSVLV